MQETNQLTVFDERTILGKEFRIYGTPEEPLFLAKDVATWIDHSNSAVMLQSIDENEKVINNVYTLGGNQDMWFLTEDGLYEILMLSRKPIAKEFKSQVKSILKQIRQTGGYIPIRDEDDDNSIMAKALIIANKTLEKKDKLIEELKPKALMAERLTETDSLLSVNQVAKVLNQRLRKGKTLGEHKLFEILRDEEILQNGGSEHNVPYQTYIDREYFQVKMTNFDNGYGKVRTNFVTKVTGKGLEWIWKTLLKKGYISESSIA